MAVLESVVVFVHNKYTKFARPQERSFRTSKKTGFPCWAKNQEGPQTSGRLDVPNPNVRRRDVPGHPTTFTTTTFFGRAGSRCVQ